MQKNLTRKLPKQSWLLLLLAAMALLIGLFRYASDPAPSTDKERATPVPGNQVTEGTPAPELDPAPAPIEPPPTLDREFSLEAGEALVSALDRQGIAPDQAVHLTRALDALVDVRKLQPGQAFRLRLTEDEAGEQFHSLTFRLDLDRRVVVRTEEGRYVGREEAVPHERRIEARSLIVSGSLAGAAAAADVPQEIIVKIVQQLGHRVNFNRDLRKGDRIDLTYERFLHPEEGEEHIGGLLSAQLQLERAGALAIYRHTTPDGIISYFDGDGVSIETDLARTPVVDGYLTSSYGPRKHPVLGISRMHRGLDFAAPKGAAVVAVRSGRVVRANRNGSFGNYVRLSHGDGLETAYAHLSGFREGLKKGDRVAKGDVIGYVGESGLATSPNLHYEVLRNGRQVDPRALDLPPRLKLQGEELARFRQQQQTLQSVFSQHRLEDPSA